MKELNWKEAEIWQETSNEEKNNNEPKWNWDCNFKLDFDGSLVYIESRFYPPHYNRGDYWEGTLNVRVLGDSILEKEFKCDTLDELKEEVETFTKNYKDTIKSKFS
jgi:hypothetical protein